MNVIDKKIYLMGAETETMLIDWADWLAGWMDD